MSVSIKIPEYRYLFVFLKQGWPTQCTSVKIEPSHAGPELYLMGGEFQIWSSSLGKFDIAFELHDKYIKMNLNDNGIIRIPAFKFYTSK